MFGETDWIFYLISSDALNSKKKRPNEEERIIVDITENKCFTGKFLTLKYLIFE